jgi:hypothetical protein
VPLATKPILGAIIDVNKRTDAGLPVTDGERAWIQAELAATPGYLEWHAADLLDKTLKLKKALV